MRKPVLIFILALLSVNSFAQTPSLQQRLYYTCKVWGFIKYYHSNVSTCHVNWDSVLVSTLPAIENASTGNAFNDALDTMLAAAGPMQIATTYFPDTLPAELKRNRDWAWLDNSGFRNDVQVQLDTIRNNFRPHANCYVEVNTNYANPNEGWLIFSSDSVELNVNTTTSYPDKNHRLLALFKYWNVVRYFYPYNYVLTTPWDTSLYNFVVPFSNVGDAYSFYLLFEKLTTNLNDAHVEGLTYSYDYLQPPGLWTPRIFLKSVGDQYIVARSAINGIHVGDALVMANGLTPTQWEDSLRPYISAGNTAVFRRFMCTYMLAGENYGQSETLVLADSTGNNYSHTASCTSNPYSDALFTDYYYPADSLNNISCTTMACDIGYVNIGNLGDTDVYQLYSGLYNKSAIIIDLRNYPISASGYSLASLMFPEPTFFAKFTKLDAAYPGTYFWDNDTFGYYGNNMPYNGKVILLMNEQTQSAAEFDCMIFGALPNVVKVGSQTAGADGDVSYWNLTQDIYTGFTTLGVYYPNGDSTQRIGIVPDSVVYPTQAGIRHHDDEVLDKALQIAGCNLAVSNAKAASPSFKVYPNPVEDVVNIEADNVGGNKAAITVTDLTGRVLFVSETQNNNGNLQAEINIKNIPAGMYIVNVKTGKGEYITKILKQ